MTEPDLCRVLSSRRILADEATPVRQQVTTRCVPGNLCPLRMHTLYVHIASKKIVPLAASRCTTGKWLSFVPLTYLELLCSLAIANVNRRHKSRGSLVS